MGMDTLFMNIINGVTLNLEIIQGAFLTIKERIFKRHTFNKSENCTYYNHEMNDILNEEMRKICKHLQIVYRYEVVILNVHVYEIVSIEKCILKFKIKQQPVH